MSVSAVDLRKAIRTFEKAGYTITGLDFAGDLPRLVVHKGEGGQNGRTDSVIDEIARAEARLAARAGKASGRA